MDVEELVISNMGLVHKEAQRYSYLLKYNHHYDYDDIVGEGIVGLIIAAQRFDESLGYQFSTYATLSIKHRIQEFIGSCGSNVYFGKSATYYASLIYKADAKNDPIDVIIEKTGLNEYKVKAGLAYLNNKTSLYLDEAINDESDSNTFHDKVFTDEVDFDKNLVMSEFYSKLKDSEKFVLYYLLRDITQKDISKIMGVTHQMVCAHVKSIREKYKKYDGGILIGSKNARVG